MRRRDLITLLGGAVAAWPLVGRAQQRGRMKRIGVLLGFPVDSPAALLNITAFVQGLQELGWSIGRNMQVEYRWGATDAERARKAAAELVALEPDVILVNSGANTEILLEATRRLPIVFVTAIDPVGAGLVASLARPGGNATGFAAFEFSLGAKWLELLKEIAPRISHVAVVRDPSVPAGSGAFGAVQSAAASWGVEVVPIDIAGSKAILVSSIGPVGDQATASDEVITWVCGRQAVPRRERDDQVTRTSSKKRSC